MAIDQEALDAELSLVALSGYDHDALTDMFRRALVRYVERCRAMEAHERRGQAAVLLWFDIWLRPPDEARHGVPITVSGARHVPVDIAPQLAAIAASDKAAARSILRGILERC